VDLGAVADRIEHADEIAEIGVRAVHADDVRVLVQQPADQRRIKRVPD
jgi:hypothetical protein